MVDWRDTVQNDHWKSIDWDQSEIVEKRTRHNIEKDVLGSRDNKREVQSTNTTELIQSNRAAAIYYIFLPSELLLTVSAIFHVDFGSYKFQK